MRRGAALAVAALATVGLLVSATALWPRADEGTAPVDPGPAAGPLDAPDLAGDGSSSGPETRPGERVPRSPATLPAQGPELPLLTEADLGLASRLRALAQGCTRS